MTIGVNYGIMAFGHTLGKAIPIEQCLPVAPSVRRRLKSWGYRNFHRAEDGIGLTDLAVEAGASALQHAEIASTDVDFMVLAISDIAEYLYWDPASAVQGRLGASRAEAILISQACASGVMSFDAAAGKLATHADYRIGLIIAANRVCETYWDRADTNTAMNSDGAAAAVVIRDFPHRRWLTTDTITDGRYADFFRLEAGGTANPFSAIIDGIDKVENQFERVRRFFGSDVQAALAFGESARERTVDVLRRACGRAGVRPADLSFIIYMNDNIASMTNLAQALDITVEQTNADLAMKHGHLGAADQIYCLEKYIASGRLSCGDIVALIGISSGMHWVCTLLRI